MQSALVALMLALLVIFFSILPQKGFVFPHLIDSGHAFVFGIGAYLLMSLFAAPDSYKTVIVCALSAFFLGVVVELVQPYIGRQRSIIDAYYDLLGCLAASFWFASSSARLGKTGQIYFRVSAVLLLIGSLAYPAYRLYIKHAVDEKAPVIADFESFWWHKVMWANNKAILERVNAPDAWSNDSQVGLVHFPAGARYPGISFAYMTPNWEKSESLSFELYSEQANDFFVIVRVHDRYHKNLHHDRFNRRLLVKPGHNSYTVSLDDIRHSPRDRELDTEHVADLMFFMAYPKEHISLYIDNIRLND